MSNENFQSISVYDLADVCSFSKVKEPFGGFSNMSNEFKVRVNGILIHNTEALYQACRFPRQAAVQKEILDQRSGMAAKMKSKHYRPQHSRGDWDEIRIDVMRWCLRVKLGQNVFGLGRLFDSTGDRPIAEQSHRDAFWGAVPDRNGTLKGQNVLGKLLMELRTEYQKGKEDFKKTLMYVEPPEIVDFLLLGDPILPVGRSLPKAA